MGVDTELVARAEDGVGRDRPDRQARGDKRKQIEDKFWPDQILKDAVACLAVLAAIMTLAIWREGRRSSDSILKIKETEQPIRLASSCCVRSSALRRRLIQVPKE